MLNILIGCNGQGKTIYLEKELEDKGKEYTVVSNLTTDDFDTTNLGISMERMTLLDEDFRDMCLAGDDIVILSSNNVGIKTEDDWVYSDAFLKIFNKIMLESEVLILDEPEFMLKDNEETILRELLVRLKDTYKEIYVATHNQDLMWEADNLYWIQDMDKKKLEHKEELYEYFGTV